MPNTMITQPTDTLYLSSLQPCALSEIKRDDYSPNSGGQRQFEYDRKLWLADRLEGIMKEAGYEGESLKLVREVMLNRNIPDPRLEPSPKQYHP